MDGHTTDLLLVRQRIAMIARDDIERGCIMEGSHGMVAL